MELNERYDARMLAAYIRGAARSAGLAPGDPALEMPLDALTEADCARLEQLARAAGMKRHYFKRQESLPRVKKVLGFLRGVGPESLLDVGSGRGVFLLPFMRAFPGVPVTALDLLDRRVALLAALRDGGLAQLEAVKGDICAWDAPDGSFDVVTLLEVLEHIPNVRAAVDNAVRLARRYVVVTVPSKPDDNPEHIHLLTKDILTGLFEDAGCANPRFDGVPGHLFMTAAVR